MLNFKQHLEGVTGKVTSRVSRRHIRCIAGTIRITSVKTIRISIHGLSFSAVDSVPLSEEEVKMVDVAISSIWLSQADSPLAYSQIDYGKVFTAIFQVSNLLG